MANQSPCGMLCVATNTAQTMFIFPEMPFNVCTDLLELTNNVHHEANIRGRGKNRSRRL
jgi:hypothetical protein